MPSVFSNEDIEFLNSRIFKIGSIKALENITTELIRAKVMVREAWRAVTHGVKKSQTRLSELN